MTPPNPQLQSRKMKSKNSYWIQRGTTQDLRVQIQEGRSSSIGLNRLIGPIYLLKATRIFGVWPHLPPQNTSNLSGVTSWRFREAAWYHALNRRLVWQSYTLESQTCRSYGGTETVNLELDPENDTRNLPKLRGIRLPGELLSCKS